MKKLICYVMALVALISVINHELTHSENYLRSRVVKLSGNNTMCSGEQIRAPSGKDYILTAAHCRHIADEKGMYAITTEDGRHFSRKFIAEDPNSDLLLIEGIPNMRGLDIASYAMPRDHVRTLTHGSNFDTYLTEGVIVGETHVQIPIEMIATPEQEAACAIMPKYIVTEIDMGYGIKLKVCATNFYETIMTAMIVPGSSGGMIINDYGNLVGVVSAGDGHFGFFTGVPAIHRFLKSF